jgi:hypothetical protein
MRNISLETIGFIEPNGPALLLQQPLGALHRGMAQRAGRKGRDPFPSRANQGDFNPITTV